MSNNFFETHCAILIAVVKQLVTAKAASLCCLSAESNVLSLVLNASKTVRS